MFPGVREVVLFGRPAWAQGFDLWKDFTKDKGKAPSLVDTHAQTIYAPTALGYYLPFAANVPVRTDGGYQSSPTRTNNIPSPNQAGVVAGTPGTAPTGTTWSSTGNGLTRTIVGTGIDPTTGLTYVDVRFAGTSTALFDIILDPIQSGSGVAAAQGQTWTASVFLALLAGTLPGTSQAVDVRGRDAANALTETLGTSFATIGSTPTRIERSLTFANVNTVKSTMAIRINAVANGAVVDFTLRIINPQLEGLTAFAGPPIVANQATNGNLPVYGGLGADLAVGVSGFIDVVNLQLGTTTTERYCEFNSGVFNERVLIGGSATQTILIATSGGVAQVTMADNYAPAVNTRVTIAYCVTAGYSNLRVVGRSAISSGAPALWPVMDRLAIGSQGYVTTGNRYLRILKKAVRYMHAGESPTTLFNDAFAKAQLAAVA